MKKKLLSEAIDETIDIMLEDYKKGIITQYTLDIKVILLMSKHLYTSFDAKCISDRANKYIRKCKNLRRDNVTPSLKNGSDILDFKCFSFVDKYVCVRKLRDQCIENENIIKKDDSVK